mmetsp:Transcript_2330/g.6553  ORF Transcript_2330/g.6553 Transcript_2330/m.6553 type:complete len:317 (-) Transcript_2330:113-1063(-)
MVFTKHQEPETQERSLRKELCSCAHKTTPLISNIMTTQTVLVAGATGYLGNFLVAEYMKRGWVVVALARDPQRAPAASKILEAEATKPEELENIMNGVDLVVSALGITRQRDGLTYRDVDYQGNMNLLNEAVRTGVKKFAYFHVLHGDQMRSVAMVDAKQAFVDELLKADIESTVICPSGFFSDMKDFLDMAQEGRVWLFGNGEKQINPIHGADLAVAAADAIAKGVDTLRVGGPDTFTHKQLAELAFETLNKEPKISYVWDGIRVMLAALVPWVTPASVSGPVQFFLKAMGMDMVGDSSGSHHLRDHFTETVAAK